RHSEARNCDIIVTVDDHAARLEIRDDGHGRSREDRRSSGSRVGVGLVGLSERVEAAGGTLVAENRPTGGFAVTATIPQSATIPHSAESACADDAPDVGIAREAVGGATPAAASAERAAGEAERAVADEARVESAP